VYFPLSYFKTEDKYPLMMTFHGLGDSCGSFGPATNFSSYSESAVTPFIFVYPCATNGLIGAAWNAGTCCLQPTTVDDVAFSRAILTAILNETVRVDLSRVWVSGFSNGAMMAEVLGCQASDVFSALASVSGVVEMEPGNDQGLANCDTALTKTPNPLPLSVFHLHGVQDDVVPMNGDELLGFPPILTDMQRWASRLSCTNKTQSTFSRGPYSGTVWPDCTGMKTHIELVLNQGGGHEWPQDSYWDTSKEIVNWFFNISHLSNRRQLRRD